MDVRLGISLFSSHILDVRASGQPISRGFVERTLVMLSRQSTEIDDRFTAAQKLAAGSLVTTAMQSARAHNVPLTVALIETMIENAKICVDPVPGQDQPLHRQDLKRVKKGLRGIVETEGRSGRVVDHQRTRLFRDALVGIHTNPNLSSTQKGAVTQHFCEELKHGLPHWNSEIVDQRFIDEMVGNLTNVLPANEHIKSPSPAVMHRVAHPPPTQKQALTDQSAALEGLKKQQVTKSRWKSRIGGAALLGTAVGTGSAGVLLAVGKGVLIGGTVCSLIPGIGTVAGALIGGALGGLAVALGTLAIAEVIRRIVGKCKAAQIEVNPPKQRLMSDSGARDTGNDVANSQQNITTTTLDSISDHSKKSSDSASFGSEYDFSNFSHRRHELASTEKKLIEKHEVAKEAYDRIMDSYYSRGKNATTRPLVERLDCFASVGTG